MSRKTLKEEPVPSINPYFQRAIDKAGSENKAAIVLKTSQGNLNRLKNFGTPGDDLVIRLAEYLGEDPTRLLLIVQTERSPEKAKPLWARLLKKHVPAAAAVLLMALVAASGATPLPCLTGAADSMYIMSN